jgi:hypothetical protein
MTKEAPILRASLDYLRLRNVFCWRQNSGAFTTPDGKRFMRTSDINGVADIIGVTPRGRFLAVECKSERGRQSTPQRQFQKAIERHNGLYIIVHSIDELIQVMDE